ncbi:sensor histidine kinase [Actinomadura yumaensis]|uniref:sensor histidine kinase n=1 Tax=Actinomadura yumaensis TaxID=111807 RepID=UPI00361A7FB5
MVGRIWDWWRTKTPLVDAAFAFPLLLLSLLGATGGAYALGELKVLVLTTVLIFPLVFRRTLPRTTFAVISLISFAQWVVGIHPIPPNASFLMVLYTVAAGRSFRWGLAAMLVGQLGSLLVLARWSITAEDAQSTGITLVVLVAGTWILGLHMRTRRAYMRSLEERAARLERERDTEVQVAMAAERARIARELHDVVAHNVSVIVVQADGASYAIETDVGRAKQALETISSTGRQALAEMRRLLGVLREGDGAGPFAPQPGVSQLNELVEQVRASGLPVVFAVEGVPEEMSEEAAHRLPHRPGGADQYPQARGPAR